MASNEEQRKTKGHYFKVLESHKKRLGDYEQIHFRKSVVVTPATNHTAQRRQAYVPYEGLSLAPRARKPMVVPFTKNTAATYLRQTESQWLVPNLSRQDATKLLFNKPTGTFVIRNSQKARYALTLRMPVDDPAVNHFLIMTNQQNFLTIQGSNLPFLSIYDLLAYFCFNKSGGMPCCLKPPDNQIQEESSDSSDSEPDEPQPYSIPSPTLFPRSVAPRVPPKGSTNSRGLEEIYIDEKKQANFLTTIQSKIKQRDNRTELSPVRVVKSKSANVSPVAKKKKIPPPKPPRTNIPLDYEDIGDDIAHKEEVALYRSARRVSGMVDMDISELCTRNRKPVSPKLNVSYGQSDSTPQNGRFPLPGGPIPAPVVISLQSENFRGGSCKPQLPASKSLDSVLQTESTSPKVNSLISMFESKLPESSPPLRHSPPKLRRNSPSPQKRHNYNVPFLPPKPQPPPIPPKPVASANGDTPVVPPRTPAPLVPPRPPGVRPLRSESGNRWSMIEPKPEPMVEKRPEESPPLSAPGRWEPSDLGSRSYKNHFYEPIEFFGAEQNKENGTESCPLKRVNVGEWLQVESGKDQNFEGSTVSQDESVEPVSGSAPSNKSSGSKWKPKGWAKKKLKFTRKPRKRVRKCIMNLAGDTDQEFGRKISEFVTDIKSRSTEPHQKLLSEIRAFLTVMHESLITDYKSELMNSGMEACDNFGHVVETTLQQFVLGQLYEDICLRIKEYYTQNDSYFKVQKSIYHGKQIRPEEMGIRRNLKVPGDKAMAELNEVFTRMTKTPCAITKLEYLLEAVRITYENVRDTKQPKKPMNDLGADDFLPLFVWVLVNCGLYQAEIEATYMWGLVPPSLFNGEGGYYLTTLTSAVNVLKELSHNPTGNASAQGQQLPTMNEMQTELKVFCEDEQTGQYSTAFYLPIVPTMTAAEICETIANKRRIPNPEKYALFKVINGKATQIDDFACPQEIKLQWTLDRNSGNTTSTGSAYQPSNRFMAYKLRAT